jgi:excinuclease UvrABC nuclease subunit
MTGKDFKDQYLRSVVYVWKRGDEYLYIGSSKRGFARMLSDSHRVIDARNIHDDDDVEVYYFDSVDEARKTERDWIHSCHPRYNSVSGRSNAYEHTRVDGLRQAELPSYQTEATDGEN